eukprot:comp23641_c0_seq1/m.40334 comp23641_c0_seq1/g.40334  ORF comp23641_c0_seq1/g.40334 comp23641_c0_seq1/m.40334 type:complete len:272 (-) comp23641_c0_seq1:737-1552(-)
MSSDSGSDSGEVANAVDIPSEQPVALPTIKESVLKRRKTLEQIREKREAQRKTEKPKKQKKETFKRAEHFVAEFVRAKKDEKRLRRSSHKVQEDKKSGKLEKAVGDNPEGRVALVMRIKPMKDSCPKTKKLLHQLNLEQVYSAVFVRLTKQNLTRLKLVEPYVAYGYPSLKTIRELVYKRGFARVDKERLPITDNAMIERELGKHGLVCLEDLVHEISTGGQNFQTVTSFLWPFKLANPHKGHTKASGRLSGSVKSGNQGDEINQLVTKMN